MFQRLCTPKTGLPLLALVLLVLVVPTSGVSTSASATPFEATSLPLVRVAPTVGVVAVGGTFDAALQVENVENLFGLDLVIQFDPTKVRVLDMRRGPFAGMDDDSEWFTIRNWDNGAGQARFAATRIASLEGVSGSGIVATIRFQGFTRTYSPVTISATASSMMNPSMAFIPFTLKSGGLFVGSIYQTHLPLTLSFAP